MKSRTSTGNVMESIQPLQMGRGVNPSWWSIRPSPPVTTITSYQQQQHHPSYDLLLHPSNINNFLPFNPPNSITLSPYSPQPTSSSNSSSWHEHDNHHQRQQDHHHQLPSETWSQLLLGGMDQDEGEKQSAATAALTQQLQTAATKMKMQNWEESQVMLQQPKQHHLHDANYESNNSMMDIKQEHPSIPSGCYNMFGQGDEEFLAVKAGTAAWSSIVMPNSSPPKSCITNFGNNNNNSMLDFSSNCKGDGPRHPAPEHPSESNSSATGGASKKARVQPSPPQSNTFKVRKEKLGDRITALHQLVSPFGKTDTASVLLETMGYIRFLQSQIEALSLPYLGSGGSGSTRQHQQQPHMHAQVESICIFPEDPGQLLNDNCIKRKASSDLQESTEKDIKKDLKSRGLCLVPLSCTLQVGSDNGADYWAPPPAFGGGYR